MERAIVLNILCFSWSAIFFYMYTSQITFAPIGSQSTKETASNQGPPLSISDPPQNSEAVSTSPSKTATAGVCSPKSVYALASKVSSPSPGCRGSNCHRLFGRLISIACAISHSIISSPNLTKITLFKSCSPLSPLSQSFRIFSRLVFPLTLFLQS